jgi:ABC-type arginine transport system ATPase subunit
MKSQSLHQRNAKLAKRIADLSEQLTPQQATQVRFDFTSLTKSEQYVLLKFAEVVQELIRAPSPKVRLESKEVLFKAHEIMFCVL